MNLYSNKATYARKFRAAIREADVNAHDFAIMLGLEPYELENILDAKQAPDESLLYKISCIYILGKFLHSNIYSEPLDTAKISARIKSKIKQFNVDPPKIAADTGLETTSIELALCNVTQNINTACSLANYFGVTLSWILFGDDSDLAL